MAARAILATGKDRDTRGGVAPWIIPSLVILRPRASRARIVAEGDILRVYVIAPPEAGKANDAVRALLAKALGAPKMRLRLLRGQGARDKIFEVS